MAVSGSGTASGATVGGTTVNISGIASNFHGSTVAAGIRFIVTSTGSGQNYTYHKATLKEDDLINLSGDINDFSERYRVGSSNPTSSLDSGDLFFNTSTGKLLVYNGTNSAWEEAQSVGNFFISTLSPAFDGTTQNFTITNAPTNAEQILLVINGVVQKPNTGSSVPSEGFALDGSTIKLGAAPATGSTYHAVVIGSTVNIGTPSNNTVTSAILQNGSVTTAKIVDANVTTAKIADNAVTSAKIADDSILSAKIAAGAVTESRLGVDSVTNAKIANNAVSSSELINNAVTTDKIANDAITEAKIANSAVSTNQLADTGVSAAKLANDAVTTAKIADDAVTGAKLANDIAISTTGTISCGDLTLTDVSPSITFTDSNDNPDYSIFANTGELKFKDETNDTVRMKINSDGTIDVNGNLDANSGLDVTGNITCTGTIPAAQLTGTLPAIDGSNLTGVSSDVVDDTSPQLGGDLQSNGNDIDFADNDKAIFGAGSDLQIYHSSNVNYIDSAQEVRIRAPFVALQPAGGGAQMALGVGGGAFELFYNGLKKFETTSNGAIIDNTVRVENINNKVTSMVNTKQNIEFKVHQTNGQSALQAAVKSNGVSGWGGQLEFYTKNADSNPNGSLIGYLTLNVNGHLLPTFNNTQDLGSSSQRWRNIYTNDLNLSNEGSSNDVDGTWGDWTIQEGESDLFLKNNRSGKKYKFNLTEVS